MVREGLHINFSIKEKHHREIRADLVQEARNALEEFGETPEKRISVFPNGEWVDMFVLSPPEKFIAFIESPSKSVYVNAIRIAHEIRTLMCESIPVVLIHRETAEYNGGKNPSGPMNLKARCDELGIRSHLYTEPSEILEIVRRELPELARTIKKS